ncbi:MAG: diguanylate cyclase [Gemmatimonadota bacterium]|nr:MAG: diguanylate cyclase [Gemmatimonadota bacterium]
MTEFEYNLLIIHKDESVRDHLVDLFDGKPSDPFDNTEDIARFREYLGAIEIQTNGGRKRVARKLHIRTAGSALEYILWWERHRQHAVLLGLEIPEDKYAKPKKETGMNLLKQINKLHPEAKVIAFTDLMIQDEAIEAIQNGAFYFIPQPQVLGMFVKALVSRIIEMKETEFVSHLDGLTGLYNKTCFNLLLEEQMVAYGDIEQNIEKRSPTQPLSLILIDIDDFKAFNENYLHLDGDNALRAMADIINDSFRASDIKGRIGGDEYGVVLPGTSHRDALDLGERLRDKTLRHRIHLETQKKEVTLTVSIGVATYPSPNPKLEKLYEAADKALLYGAKEYGKDMVCGYDNEGNICSYYDLKKRMETLAN